MTREEVVDAVKRDLDTWLLMELPGLNDDPGKLSYRYAEALTTALQIKPHLLQAPPKGPIDHAG